MNARRVLVPATAILAVAGGLAIVLGAALPWLTLYGGLHPMRGIIGAYGWLLLGGGLASSAIMLLPWQRPRSGARLGGVVALLILGFSSWIAFVEIPATLASLRRNPFLVAGRGVGPYVIVAGSLLLVLASCMRMKVARPARQHE